jgi:molybdenum-dependent DNA-binding transcriptional regulator ModE
MGAQGGPGKPLKRMLCFLPSETWEVVLADGFGDIELFRAVVEAGGISAGAEALGSSPTAVSRRVKALEARLGVRLADRSARRFRLTDEGRSITSIAATS